MTYDPEIDERGVLRRVWHDADGREVVAIRCGLAPGWMLSAKQMAPDRQVKPTGASPPEGMDEVADGVFMSIDFTRPDGTKVHWTPVPIDG